MRIPSKAGLQRRTVAATTNLWRRTGRARAQRRLSRALPEHARVHLGCGPVHLDGWVNVDIDRAKHPDVRLDLRFGFPARSDSVAYVFSEHVFEHLTLDDGLRVLKDCRVALIPGGVMRIAMPDLRYLVDRYCDNWKDQAWLQDPALQMIDSPARMLNFALRSWEHLYVYDLEELTLRLREVGFNLVEPREPGQSDHPELRGLELRPDSLLVVEATK